MCFGINTRLAPGETDEGRERRTLVAALVLLDLDDHSWPSDIASWIRARPTSTPALKNCFATSLKEEIRGVRCRSPRTRLRGWARPADDAFVDVAFSLFLRGRFDVEVYEFLTFDDRDTEFLGCVALKSMRFIVSFSRAHGQDKPSA